MRNLGRIAAVCAILVAFAARLHAATDTAGSAAATQWNALVDEYLDQVAFHFRPTDGTSAGLHQYDSLLEDYSRSAIDSNIRALHQFEKRVVAFNGKGLSQTEAADREIVLGNIRSSLLTLEIIRPWEKNPDTYSSGVTNSVYVIMNRKFASSDDRLKSVIAREKQMPAVFDRAKLNLKNPPRIYTEIALQQLPGLVSFFKNDVPAAFADAKDENIKAEFAKSNAAVVEALQKYEAWLKSDLLARSNGDFRFGAQVYSKKLLYDEMVDTPIDRLLEIGLADLHRNQAEFARIAKEVDASKSPREVLEQLGATHPPPDQLIPHVHKKPSTASSPSSMTSTSSRSRLISGPLSKRRRHLNAPQPPRRWTHPALLKK